MKPLCPEQPSPANGGHRANGFLPWGTLKSDHSTATTPRLGARRRASLTTVASLPVVGITTFRRIVLLGAVLALAGACDSSTPGLGLDATRGDGGTVDSPDSISPPEAQCEHEYQICGDGCGTCLDGERCVNGFCVLRVAAYDPAATEAEDSLIIGPAGSGRFAVLSRLKQCPDQCELGTPILNVDEFDVDGVLLSNGVIRGREVGDGKIANLFSVPAEGPDGPFVAWHNLPARPEVPAETPGEFAVLQDDRGFRHLRIVPLADFAQETYVAGSWPNGVILLARTTWQNGEAAASEFCTLNTSTGVCTHLADAGGFIAHPGVAGIHMIGNDRFVACENRPGGGNRWMDCSYYSKQGQLTASGTLDATPGHVGHIVSVVGSTVVATINIDSGDHQEVWVATLNERGEVKKTRVAESPRCPGTVGQAGECLFGTASIGMDDRYAMIILARALFAPDGSLFEVAVVDVDNVSIVDSFQDGAGVIGITTNQRPTIVARGAAALPRIEKRGLFLVEAMSVDRWRWRPRDNE